MCYGSLALVVVKEFIYEKCKNRKHFLQENCGACSWAVSPLFEKKNLLWMYRLLLLTNSEEIMAKEKARNIYEGKDDSKTNKLWTDG